MVEVMLAAMVLSALFTSGVRAVSDARAVRKAADAGAWDFLDRDRDRREVRRQRRAEAWRSLRRRRNRQAGGDGVYRPGAGAYLADLYHGYWEDQLAKREAKRAARPELAYVFDPETGKLRRNRPDVAGRPSLADRINARLDRLDAVIRERVARARESRLARAVAEHPLVRPVGEGRPAAASPEPSQQAVARPAPSGGPAAAPNPQPEPAPAPASAAAPTPGARPAGQPGPDAAPEPDSDDDGDSAPTTPTDSTGGTDMTQATGEATTYEQHKTELAAARQGWQTYLDLATASIAAVTQAEAALNAQAEHARQVAAAAVAKVDSLAGAGLDGETQGHAAVQAEAVDVNRLDAQYEALAQMRADAEQAVQRAEAALAAVDAEEATIDAKYGDSATTVASELGGDASYLDSGGGSGPVGSWGGTVEPAPGGALRRFADGTVADDAFVRRQEAWDRQKAAAQAELDAAGARPLGGR